MANSTAATTLARLRSRRCRVSGGMRMVIARASARRARRRRVRRASRTSRTGCRLSLLGDELEADVLVGHAVGGQHQRTRHAGDGGRVRGTPARAVDDRHEHEPAVGAVGKVIRRGRGHVGVDAPRPVAAVVRGGPGRVSARKSDAASRCSGQFVARVGVPRPVGRSGRLARLAGAVLVQAEARVPRYLDRLVDAWLRVDNCADLNVAVARALQRRADFARSATMRREVQPVEIPGRAAAGTEPPEIPLALAEPVGRGRDRRVAAGDRKRVLAEAQRDDPASAAARTLQRRHRRGGDLLVAEAQHLHEPHGDARALVGAARVPAVVGRARLGRVAADERRC